MDRFQQEFEYFEENYPMHIDGSVQILAVQQMYEDSDATYRTLFQDLKRRGLQKVWLCVSDAYKGLQVAIRKEFISNAWQRCKVHFMRNILAHVGHPS